MLGWWVSAGLFKPEWNSNRTKFYELSKPKERKENGNIFYEITFKMGRRKADQPVTISNTSQQTSRALCRPKYWTWLIQNQHFTPLTHWLLWPEISFIVFIRLVFIVIHFAVAISQNPVFYSSAFKLELLIHTSVSFIK